MSRKLHSIRIIALTLLISVCAPIVSFAQDALWLELNSRGMKAYEDGDLGSAEKFYREALEVAANGELRAEMSATLNNLGLVFKATGRLEEAASVLHNALELRFSVYGERHRYTAQSMNNLGRLMEALGRYSAAEQLYSQAVDIYSEWRGGGTSVLAGALTNLASLYERMGRLQDAYRNLSRAVTIYDVALPAGHPKLASTVNTLATA